MNLRVVQRETQFVGNVADFEQHKHHRHHQQDYTCHRPGKAGHQCGGEGHQFIGVDTLQQAFRRHVQVEEGQHLLQMQNLTRQLLVVFRQHGDEFID